MTGGDYAMGYTLERFAADCREALSNDPGLAGRELVRQYTEKACIDPEFVAQHDHGPSWAVYSQVTGATEMTDWKLVERPENGKPGKVIRYRIYNLTPGKAHPTTKAICIHHGASPKRD
jgi:hypothetical protein